MAKGKRKIKVDGFLEFNRKPINFSFHVSDLDTELKRTPFHNREITQINVKTEDGNKEHVLLYRIRIYIYIFWQNNLYCRK